MDDTQGEFIPLFIYLRCRFAKSAIDVLNTTHSFITIKLV